MSNLTDLLPGICYTLVGVFLLLPLEGIGIYLTIGRLAEIRPFLPAKLGLLAACVALGGMVIYVADWDNILPTFAVFLIAMAACTRGRMMKRITLGLMLSSTVFAFNALVDNQILDLMALDWIDHSGTWNFLRLVLRVLFGLGLYAVARRSGARRDFDLSPAMWRLLFLLTLSPLGIVFCLILLTDYGSVMYGNEAQETAFLLLALFGFIGLFWTMLVLERQQKLEKEHLLEEQNRRYYEAMERQHFEIRRLKHDLRNHLQTALAMPAGEKDAYLKELFTTLSDARMLKYCGDHTVNIILSAKAALMEEKGIRFEAKVDIPGQLSMDKTDICAIFGNALDNAIEAVDSILTSADHTPGKKAQSGTSQSSARQITLEARHVRGLLILSIRNPGTLKTCHTREERVLSERNPGTLKADTIILEARDSAGLFKWNAVRQPRRNIFGLPMQNPDSRPNIPTTKSDPSAHGYGLPSIQTALDKYNGVMELREENGEVVLFIYCHL